MLGGSARNVALNSWPYSLVGSPKGPNGMPSWAPGTAGGAGSAESGGAGTVGGSESLG